MKKNLIYQVIEIFWRFVLCSFYFYLSNVVLIVSLLTLKFSLVTSPIYLIGLVLLYPSIGGLADLLKDRSSNIEFIAGFKKYFHFYWVNRFKYLKIGLLYTGIVIFLLFDMYAVNAVIKNQLFSPMILVLLILTLVSLGWIIGIQSFFKIDVKNSLKMSFYALSHFGLNSLMIVLLFFLIYMSVSFIPQFMAFIIAPVVIEGLILLTKKPLQQIRLQLHIH